MVCCCILFFLVIYTIKIIQESFLILQIIIVPAVCLFNLHCCFICIHLRGKKRYSEIRRPEREKERAISIKATAYLKEVNEEDEEEEEKEKCFQMYITIFLVSDIK